MLKGLLIFQTIVSPFLIPNSGYLFSGTGFKKTTFLKFIYSAAKDRTNRCVLQIPELRWRDSKS